MRAPRLSEDDLAQRGIHAAEDLGRDDPLWPGQLAIAAAILLLLALPSRLALGPKLLVPAAEMVLFLGLFVPTLLRGPRRARLNHDIVITVLLVGTVTNLVSLGLLINYLLAGGHARSTDLTSGGAVIWVTNLFLFTVWYWVFDRGGPLKPAVERTPVAPDFLFPQMTDDRYAAPGWKPRFGDYLYVSLTNQTAFSPTDTMPLSLRVKLLMGVQALAAFATVGVILARAVNILA
ncbi:MAG: hypothetical protein QOF37_2745 [Thermoleophilaceae bacterium]|jgi:uncharacterized membrane protein|nr:hypothetical protein [Thermoleophilaceae bacterium]